MVPYLLPLPVLALLPRILELITGGRGVTFVLLSHIWPTFLAAVGLTAATGIMVTTARIRSPATAASPVSFGTTASTGAHLYDRDVSTGTGSVASRLPALANAVGRSVVDKGLESPAAR
ncbi:hypothetical protein GWI34_05750 [Actinomadura sp. DSM 109109]|nr:hypothetical protein [Actinomadura lepetitiana]